MGVPLDASIEHDPRVNPLNVNLKCTIEKDHQYHAAHAGVLALAKEQSQLLEDIWIVMTDDTGGSSRSGGVPLASLL
jgi:hypothetical protein